MPGPKGTAANMLNAESVLAKKPAFDHAASTEPWPVAWMAWSAGTSAPGSFTRSSICPAERRFSFCASLPGASPISVRLFGNAFARLMRTFCCACAGAPSASVLPVAAAIRSFLIALPLDLKTARGYYGKIQGHGARSAGGRQLENARQPNLGGGAAR